MRNMLEFWTKSSALFFQLGDSKVRRKDLAGTEFGNLLPRIVDVASEKYDIYISFR